MPNSNSRKTTVSRLIVVPGAQISSLVWGPVRQTAVLIEAGVL
jgi:hypothetical protein